MGGRCLNKDAHCHSIYSNGKPARHSGATIGNGQRSNRPCTRASAQGVIYDVRKLNMLNGKMRNGTNYGYISEYMCDLNVNV